MTALARMDTRSCSPLSLLLGLDAGLVTYHGG